jgi:hypothetical protein
MLEEVLISLLKTCVEKLVFLLDMNCSNYFPVLVGDELYSATVADFTGVDPIIFRHPLRTQQYDSTQLNSPDFVGSLEHKVKQSFLFIIQHL